MSANIETLLYLDISYYLKLMNSLAPALHVDFIHFTWYV